MTEKKFTNVFLDDYPWTAVFDVSFWACADVFSSRGSNSSKWHDDHFHGYSLNCYFFPVRFPCLIFHGNSTKLKTRCFQPPVLVSRWRNFLSSLVLGESDFPIVSSSADLGSLPKTSTLAMKTKIRCSRSEQLSFWRTAGPLPPLVARHFRLSSTCEQTFECCIKNL